MYPKPRIMFNPDNRVTRLCMIGLNAIEASPEFRETDRIIILLSNNDDYDNAAQGQRGYHPESYNRYLTDLAQHCQSACELIGLPWGTFIDGLRLL